MCLIKQIQISNIILGSSKDLHAFLKKQNKNVTPEEDSTLINE